jgi:hypothetical protein
MQGFWLHVAYGLFMFGVAVFNGATYYIEVFSVRYQVGCRMRMHQLTFK